MLTCTQSPPGASCCCSCSATNLWSGCAIGSAATGRTAGGACEGGPFLRRGGGTDTGGDAATGAVAGFRGAVHAASRAASTAADAAATPPVGHTASNRVSEADTANAPSMISRPVTVMPRTRQCLTSDLYRLRLQLLEHDRRLRYVGWLCMSRTTWQRSGAQIARTSDRNSVTGLGSCSSDISRGGPPCGVRRSPATLGRGLWDGDEVARCHARAVNLDE